MKQKIHEEVLFKYTFRPSWKVLAAVESCYSLENPLAPASEERKSIVEISVRFKAHLRNLVRSSFLVALQTVYCKPATPVKRGLLEISFRSIQCTC